MLLSSLDRLKIYITTVSSGSRTELTDGTANDAELLGWLASVSKTIEKEMGRLVELVSRTEYFDTTYNRRMYFVKAFPVTTLTSVYEDSEGQYDGSESEVTDSIISSDANAIVLDYPISWLSRKGLRVIYTGGLAEHPVRSTFAISGVGGTWTADKFVQGQSSKAMGKVVSSTASSIVIANLYGIFEADEDIQEQDTEGTQGASDGTATIDSITTQSLAEVYPDIARACEMQVRYMWKHKHDFENQTTAVDGTTRRTGDAESGKLQPEVMDMLSRYIRHAVV